MPHLIWTNEARLSAGLTLRADGDMRLPDDGLVRADVLRRRCAALTAQFPGARIAAPLPIHGATVGTVTGNESFHEAHALFAQTDALVTAVPGIVLTVTVADCLPVFFFDPVVGTIGLAHAGWRGLVASPQDVLAATVQALVALGSKPGDIRAEVGPSVGPCHYAVDAARRAQFAARFGDDVVCHEALDLRRAALRALVTAGLAVKRIAAESLCTACQADRFFSHRVDGHAPPKAGMAWIALRLPG